MAISLPSSAMASFSSHLVEQKTLLASTRVNFGRRTADRSSGCLKGIPVNSRSETRIFAVVRDNGEKIEDHPLPNVSDTDEQVIVPYLSLFYFIE